MTNGGGAAPAAHLAHLADTYHAHLADERRARAFFLEQVASLPDGTEREIYRELTAEEDEHIAVLETERQYTRAALNAEAG